MTARGLNRFRCRGTRVDDLSRIRLNAYIRDRLMDQVTGARRRVDNGYLAPAAHGSVDATAEERGSKCERHRGVAAVCDHVALWCNVHLVTPRGEALLGGTR